MGKRRNIGPEGSYIYRQITGGYLYKMVDLTLFVVPTCYEHWRRSNSCSQKEITPALSGVFFAIVRRSSGLQLKLAAWRSAENLNN